MISDNADAQRPEHDAGLAVSWVWGSATAGHITLPDYERARAIAGRVLRAVRPRRPRRGKHRIGHAPGVAWMPPAPRR